jgi:hypothetical protein
MSAMVLTLTYGMCCWTVLHIRRKGLPTQAPTANWLIWLALIGSSLMAACALLIPFWQQPGFPLEYQLLTAWGLLGYIVWRYALTRQSGPGSPSSLGPS